MYQKLNQYLVVLYSKESTQDDEGKLDNDLYTVLFLLFLSRIEGKKAQQGM